MFALNITFIFQRDVKVKQCQTLLHFSLLLMFSSMKIFILHLSVDSQNSFNANNASHIFRLNPLCPKHLVFLKTEEIRGWWFLYRWPISLNPLCKGMVLHSITFFDFNIFRMQLSSSDCRN